MSDFESPNPCWREEMAANGGRRGTYTTELRATVLEAAPTTLELRRRNKRPGVRQLNRRLNKYPDQDRDPRLRPIKYDEAAENEEA